MKPFLISLLVLFLLGLHPVKAGSFAPAPRVIATYERNFLERTGSQTLQELLDTGIIRYFLTGGQALLVLVNGRPYASTSSNLDTLPISAIERLELLGGESLGSMGAGTVHGALNVVLRKDLDGVEMRAVARMPSRDGGDGWQGSAFWGGAVGQGRMTVGADIIDRQEIPAKSREHSRSYWVEGGSFSQSKNVSISGNTVFVVKLDEDGERELGADGKPREIRSVPLGECDPTQGYVPGLGNPAGITSGDKGCGFAYGNIAWNTSSQEQRNAILNLHHPLGEDAELHLDANVTQSDSAFRYAPSVDVFSFSLKDEEGNITNQGLLDAINDAACRAETGEPCVPGAAPLADGDDRFSVGHRFVAHGNRDWLTETEGYDLSVGVEGRLTQTLGYDLRFRYFRFDRFLSGDTLVHSGRIQEEIRAGNYDLADPFSDAPEHLEAIRKSSLREEEDAGTERLSARLALEGSAFSIGGRDTAWSAGVELGKSESHSFLRFRDNEGMTHKVTEVLGSGGTSYAGERKSAAAFADMSLPLTEELDLRLAGRAAELDDVGGLESWRVGAEYRPTAILTLRGHWGAGEEAPSMQHLYSTEAQGHPYILCDPGSAPPPRTCAAPNPRQVTQEVRGNRELDPTGSSRLTIGAEARQGPFFLGADWYRLSVSGSPGVNTATWAMLNLDECAPGGAKENCIERNGGDITIHQGYDNIVDSEISGINTRFGGGFRTGWGVVGMRGAWRHVIDAEQRFAGVKERFVIAKNAIRVGFLARRDNLSAVWTVNYRSSFENQTGSGTFDSWTGHDLVLDWAAPLGLEGARVTGGVFNLTDAGLTVDTANPSSTDGPTAAGWGRTFFLTLNMRF